MAATLSLSFVGLLCGGLQEGKAGGLVRVEPGLQWVYEGTLKTTTTGEREDRGEFTVRVRYLALEKTGDGGVRLALVQQVDPATGAGEGEKRHAETYAGTPVLELDADLRLKRYGVYWFKPANLHLNLAPFPPREVSAAPGERRTSDHRFVTMPWQSFKGGQLWTTEPAEGGVRMTCTPTSLPVSEGEGENKRSLESYRETHLVDPAAGLVRDFELTWRVRSAEETEETTIVLRLGESKEMNPEELRARRAEIEAVTTIEEKLWDEGSDLDALAKEAATLPPRFTGSSLLAAAEDLKGEIQRMKESRDWFEQERRTHERLLGKAAPEFTGKDLEGEALSLASLRGKVVLLNFWASW